MATLDSLFSSPGMLNRTGVTIKLRSPITDAEIAKYESGPETTRNIMSAETLKSLRNAAGGGDTIRLNPGEVGVEKTPEFSQEIFKHASTQPLLGGRQREYWELPEVPGAKLEDILREPETEAQLAMKRAQMGSTMMGPGVQELAQNVQSTRGAQLEALLGLEGTIGAKLTSPEMFRHVLQGVSWKPTDEYEKNLEQQLGWYAKKPEQKASGWGDFAKQAAGVILAPLTGGLGMGLTMVNMIRANEAKDKQQKAFEEEIRKMQLANSTMTGKPSKQVLEELFADAMGQEAPLDSSVYRSGGGAYTALGGF